jgi:hypothetical protein
LLQRNVAATDALFGFALFFGGTWLRLMQVGVFKYASNPYAGPPPLLTCLFCGGFGPILGAVLSSIQEKKLKIPFVTAPNSCCHI